MTEEAYDPNVCYLTLLEENYLFVLERSKGNCDVSDSQRCSWDLQNQTRVPRAFPSNYSDPQTYFCDGNYRSLAWPIKDTDAGILPSNGSAYNGEEGSPGANGYKCICGGPIYNNETRGTTDRPWKGSFGKRCNYMTDYSFTKGGLKSSTELFFYSFDYLPLGA